MATAVMDASRVSSALSGQAKWQLAVGEPWGHVGDNLGASLWRAVSAQAEPRVRWGFTSTDAALCSAPHRSSATCPSKRPRPRRHPTAPPGTPRGPPPAAAPSPVSHLLLSLSPARKALRQWGFIPHAVTGLGWDMRGSVHVSCVLEPPGSVTVPTPWDRGQALIISADTPSDGGGAGLHSLGTVTRGRGSHTGAPWPGRRRGPISPRDVGKRDPGGAAGVPLWPVPFQTSSLCPRHCVIDPRDPRTRGLGSGQQRPSRGVCGLRGAFLAGSGFGVSGEPRKPAHLLGEVSAAPVSPLNHVVWFSLP